MGDPHMAWQLSLLLSLSLSCSLSLALCTPSARTADTRGCGCRCGCGCAGAGAGVLVGEGLGLEARTSNQYSDITVLAPCSSPKKKACYSRAYCRARGAASGPVQWAGARAHRRQRVPVNAPVLAWRTARDDALEHLHLSKVGHTCFGCPVGDERIIMVTFGHLGFGSRLSRQVIQVILRAKGTHALISART